MIKPSRRLFPFWPAVAVAAALMGCEDDAGLVTSEYESPLFDLVECPHDWMAHFNPDSLVDAGQLALPGLTTNIPEFHDCQKFVATSGSGPRYLPIAAVFGAWDLAARWDSVVAHPATDSSFRQWNLQVSSLSGDSAATASLASVIVPPLTATPDPNSPSARSAWGFLEIVSETDYAPLGIARGFNCAFLYYAGDRLQVMMVNYPGRTEPDCRSGGDPDSMGGTVLEVRRFGDPAHSSADDYPAVARWDWDPENHVQIVSVKCGDAWCEFGPPGFAESNLPIVPAIPAAPTPDEHRVRSIRGWFDHQRLAPPDVASPSGPGPGWGTVVPAPDLGARRVTNFEATWVLAARVVLDTLVVRYRDKLNLVPTWGDSTNRIYLCKGSFDVCRKSAGEVPEIAAGLASAGGPPVCSTGAAGVLAGDAGVWWAAIVSAANQVAFRCVIRRDHGAAFKTLGIEPVGYVRWRWRAGDETIWISCDAGCCEVESMGG